MENKRLYGPVVVAVDHERDADRWTLSEDSAIALKYAHTITAGAVIAVATVPNPDLDALSQCGVEEVYVTDDLGDLARLSSANVDVITQVLEQVGDTAEVVILPSTTLGRETAGRLGMRLRSAVVTDVTDVSPENGSLHLQKRVLGGAWETHMSLAAATPVITLARKDDHNPQEWETTETRVTKLETGDLADPRVEIVKAISRPADSGVGLKDAQIVVVGGRGVGGDFGLVNDLAEALGGAVGATRVACDEGWVDRSLQIGQTGVTIAPKIYVGLGVSGAIHHACGIQGSETIVAICDDPDAPIFEMADFGIIGDVTTVVPQALARLQELRAGQ